MELDEHAIKHTAAVLQAMPGWQHAFRLDNEAEDVARAAITVYLEAAKTQGDPVRAREVVEAAKRLQRTYSTGKLGGVQRIWVEDHKVDDFIDAHSELSLALATLPPAPEQAASQPAGGGEMDCREAFELWMLDNGYAGLDSVREGDFRYNFWKPWQAAWSARSTPPTEAKGGGEVDEKRYTIGFDMSKGGDVSCLAVSEGGKIVLMLYGEQAEIVQRLLERTPAPAPDAELLEALEKTNGWLRFGWDDPLPRAKRIERNRKLIERHKQKEGA